MISYISFTSCGWDKAKNIPDISMNISFISRYIPLWKKSDRCMFIGLLSESMSFGSLPGGKESIRHIAIRGKSIRRMPIGLKPTGITKDENLLSGLWLHKMT